MEDLPCSACAVSCALGHIPEDTNRYISSIKADGYATLDVANKYIRKHLAVKKRTDFRRGLRPKLKNLHYAGRAIVCVYGHFIYLDHEEYWSFFDNTDDEGVSVWMLK